MILMIAIGISLHNFPEGMAVFLGSIKVRIKEHDEQKISWSRRSNNILTGHSQRIININCCLLDFISQGMRVGVNLALAIALHNIPEVQIL